MKKYEVILFQPSIRRFVLNFGKYLKTFSFTNLAASSSARTAYARLTDFDQEIIRRKMSPFNRVRRILGIPNVRLWFNKRGDVLFTYGSLVVTPKPYCVYIETGLTLYNYDLGIAKHPVARLIVMTLATRRNCQRLIFLSQAAKKSFFSTVTYPPRVRHILEAKSSVIYPIPIAKQAVPPKKRGKDLKLLFIGMVYIKGGMEVAHAYEALRKTSANVTLTMVTALHVLRQEDIAYLHSLPGLTLLDAKLSEQEMITTYRSHDVFVLPTYREGFGLVFIEALAYGMPVIMTDQYATSEMAIEGYNGFIYPDHPLKDYEQSTYKLLGRYYEPIYFYAELFRLQKAGKFKPIERWIVKSIRRFIDEPKLLEQFSKHSLALYNEKFDPNKLGQQIEDVFQHAVDSTR